MTIRGLNIYTIISLEMSVLGAFCNQMIRLCEELQASFPEEKSISMALEAIKAAKRSNPKLILDLFHEYVYTPTHDLIANRKDDEIIVYARKSMTTQYNEIMPTLMIFDKYWLGMSQSNKDVIWQYLDVLCKLCERAKA